MTLHVFTGPTLSPEEVLESRPDAVVHRPVAHGDLLRGDIVTGDVVVIIDGLYHQRAPVRHKEILLLLERGVHVVGCSSMGALRAAELHQCGMVGHGRVFEMYRDGEIEADDEVAVVHGREQDLSSRNSPLVSVRWAARVAAEAGVLTPGGVAEIVGACGELHYTERSWRMLRLHLDRTGRDPSLVDRVVDFLHLHPEHASIKRKDAFDTLASLDAHVARPAAVVTDGPWRNRFVFDWEVEHRGEQTDDGLVSHADLIRHHQIFSKDFPAIWRSYVLGELAEHAGADESEIAAHWVEVLGLSSPDRVPCLTAAERGRLCLDEAVLRALVRGFSSPRALHDLRARFPHLTADPALAEQVRTAHRLNAETWWRGRERIVDRLPSARLTRLLAELWDCPTSSTELTAAGRDRGFATVEHAVDAARTYFLAHQARTLQGQRPRWRVS